MLPVLRGSLPVSPFAGAPLGRLDSIFDRFFGNEGNGGSGQVWTWSHMPVAMWTDEENLYLEVEAPGVAEQDVEITVHGDVLSIKVQRPEIEGRKYLYNGRVFGRFERDVVLPEAVDTERIEATLTGGLLNITLPKTPESRPKKISLKTS
jgi:HSP20 family protein